MVNRLWQHHFGEGIVRTPSDFGINGERPSHPELLDWLATQFVEKKWSLKAMHRLMLTSNTYRQSTENPEQKKYAEADPKNQLLWRMNWLRLEGEAIRDSCSRSAANCRIRTAVPACSSTCRRMLPTASNSSNGSRRMKRAGARTIYTFQRRSVMNPMIEVFDGANMSEVCSRRSATVVPTQAFTLLNSEFMNNTARHFAERVIELAGPDRTRKSSELSVRPWAAAVGAERRRQSDVCRKARRRVADALGVVLFNLNEFLYLE